MASVAWAAGRHPHPHRNGGETHSRALCLNLVNSPNRFNPPAFFELHVWAWRTTPLGSFVDWNNQVTCEEQTSDPPDPGEDN